MDTADANRRKWVYHGQPFHSTFSRSQWRFAIFLEGNTSHWRVIRHHGNDQFRVIAERLQELAGIRPVGEILHPSGSIHYVHKETFVISWRRCGIDADMLSGDGSVFRVGWAVLPAHL